MIGSPNVRPVGSKATARAPRSASPLPPAREAPVLDQLMPFSVHLYELGRKLSVAQLPHEMNQAYAERLAATITERQYTLERLRAQLTTKE